MTSVRASRLSGPAPKPHHINPGLHQSSVEWPHSLPFSLKPQDISQSLRTSTWMLEHPNLTPLGAPSIPNDRDERFPSQNEDLKGCICAQALEPLEYTSLTINSQQSEARHKPCFRAHGFASDSARERRWPGTELCCNNKPKMKREEWKRSELLPA